MSVIIDKGPNEETVIIYDPDKPYNGQLVVAVRDLAMFIVNASRFIEVVEYQNLQG